MKIYCAQHREPSQIVNSLGKNLYKNLPGAYNYEKHSNMFNVYTVVLYQIPYDLIQKYNLEEDKYKEVHEMEIEISITTYGQKIRVNFVELTPEELTLGHATYDVNKYPTFALLREAIWWFLEDRLSKRYEDYDFLF